MEKSTIHLTPFFITVDGVPVTILEVLKTQLISGETHYHVAVRFNYKGVTSRTVSLHVKDMKELVNKLKIEVTKIKLVDYAYGIEEVRRQIR
ncbi:MAG: hypothetical protein QXP16_03945 [Candidatus Bathyarchaeia archaeon]